MPTPEGVPVNRPIYIMVLGCAILFQTACQKDVQSRNVASIEIEESEDSHTSHTDDDSSHDIEDHIQNDPTVDLIEELGCIRANSRQLAVVDDGNEKKSEFLNVCIQQTGSSHWCQQLVRPNPKSVNTFRCTYGQSQAHQLINPNKQTWQYPIQGVKLIQHLQNKGIKVCEIYNWWRPEPYNKNVGGASGRHPYGTSIDVRFCSRGDANLAFAELCKLRAQKHLRALGDYGSSSLHLGIGDARDNTWGKSCPGS